MIPKLEFLPARCNEKEITDGNLCSWYVCKVLDCIKNKGDSEELDVKGENRRTKDLSNLKCGQGPNIMVSELKH